MNISDKISNIITAAIEKAESLPVNCGRGVTRDRIDALEFNIKGYSEPGYSDPESGIICLGNYNNPSRYDDKSRKHIDLSDLPSRVAKVLTERYGVELEWSDEWTTCEDCGKLVRTQPDSYGWQRYWSELNGSTICGDCIKKDPSDYLESLEGEPNKAITITGIDPEKHGYVKILGNLENGWHGGQDDDPRKVAESLRAKGVSNFLFVIDSVGQFDLKFSVFVHESEYHDATDKADVEDGDAREFTGNTKADEDPAEVLKRGLQSASKAISSLPDGPGSNTPRSRATPPRLAW